MQELKEFIKTAHNPKLINRELAPLANEIYHVYSDGEITEQKGGEVYGRRTERTLDVGFSNGIDAQIFPIQINTAYGVFGYAITTYQDAKKIREMIGKIMEY